MFGLDKQKKRRKNLAASIAFAEQIRADARDMLFGLDKASRADLCGFAVFAQKSSVANVRRCAFLARAMLAELVVADIQARIDAGEDKQHGRVAREVPGPAET